MQLALNKLSYNEDTPLILFVGFLALVPCLVLIKRVLNARYNKRIFQLIHDGQGEHFVAVLRQDIETEPNPALRSNLELKLGMGLLLMGRWKEARAALALIDSSYIQGNSRRWFHMSNLQVVLRTDLEEAHRYFIRNNEQFIADSPKPLINQAIRLHNGMVEFLIMQDPHAEKVFLAISRECPDPVIKSAALYFLARIEHDRGKTDIADEYFKQSQQLTPHIIHGSAPDQPWITRGRAARKK
jgi:tetratricopeptide (TPR) repeat protein